MHPIEFIIGSVLIWDAAPNSGVPGMDWIVFVVRQARCMRFAVFFAICLAAPLALFGTALAQETPTSRSSDSQFVLADTESEDVESETGAETDAILPPLPFVAPQVGPLIKRGYQDDVDRRTTAFFPQSLDFMTPISMPVTDERWVRVDLSEQVLVAYQGDKPLRAFKVSSGLPGTPTVTGEFRIRMKVRSQLMAGGSGSNYYYLPNVEWVQYFYQDYGLHGTYWHNDFGRPKSHGCVNMTNADAKWLYFWLGPEWDGKTIWQRSTEKNPGSLVIVHE